MGRSPRPQYSPQPSPLQQVQFTRPLSQPPQEMGLVRDPQFWKRFSTAVHMAEEGSVDPASTPGTRTNSSTSTFTLKDSRNDWLAKQRKKKRRCRMLCALLTLLVVLFGAGAGFAIWYFLKVRK